MENFIQEMTEINDKLLEASEKYYQEDIEIMTNAEYDELYDKLVNLEKKYKFILSDSITQKVGHKVLSTLVKEKHEEKALSLDKTKDRDALVDWLSDKEGVLSYKMDGITIVATYNNGKLQKAVTRGNGEIGEVVTHNARYFVGLPNEIEFNKKLIIRGEAFMLYSEFDKINNLLGEEVAKYKNPRNLASGTIRQLDASSLKIGERQINFKAFELVQIDSDIFDKNDTFDERFKFLKEQKFDVVDYKVVNRNTLKDTIEYYEKQIPSNDFPSDGLVLFFNDVKYGKSLGCTAKFPRNGIAFKWKDETAVTTVRDIKWQTSRTGLINPVAVFDTVELEGTDVSRATANNISVIEKLGLCIGSKISVYKANMIIPTILKVEENAGIADIPKFCPSCGKPTRISVSEEGIKTLKCDNSECPAQNVKKFEHFVSRNAMNIVGLSKQTLEKFIDYGFIKNFTDIYEIEKYKEEIINLDGFGQKSYDNLINSIEKSKTIYFYNFLFALGIPNIGIATAKDICKILKIQNEADFLKLFENNFDFSSVQNIGEIINTSMYEWYAKEENKNTILELSKFMNFITDSVNNSSKISGKSFVITGTLNKFTNRDELIKKIEDFGGKVIGSVSNKTDFLINNDINSNSSKNKKAKELNIPIITEEDFLNMLG